MNMNNGMNNGYNQQFNTQLPNQGSVPGYMLWLILGVSQIITMCCCCNCISFIFGILTVVFVCMANSEFKKGNMISCTSKMKTAKILNIVGWVIVIVGTVLSISLGLVEELMLLFE